LLEKLDLETGKPDQMVWREEQIRNKLRVVSIQALRESGVLERIMMQPNAPAETGAEVDSERIANADAGSLLEIANELL